MQTLNSMVEAYVHCLVQLVVNRQHTARCGCELQMMACVDAYRNESALYGPASNTDQ